MSDAAPTSSDELLVELFNHGGEVTANYFRGRGGKYISWLANRGYIEWMRAKQPYSLVATSLRITPAGFDYLKGVKAKK